MKKGNIKLAGSLFSYAYEWNSGDYTLEQMIAESRKRNLGTGLEVIGFQSLRNFPHISEQQVSELRALMERYAFEPVCLDANIDVAIRRHRYMDVDETVEYMKPQIKAAQRLGFPILRVQMTAKPEVIRKVAPFAEKANVKLGMELHTPYNVHHPAVLALRELYAELDSPYLGFIPDMGTSMRAIPEALLGSFKEAGVTDEMISITKEIWLKDAPMPAKFGELQERTAALGATPPQIGRLNMAFAMNGRQPIEAWKEIIPQTVHLHGKFYGIDENGEEPSIDYPLILKTFVEGGYNGYIASEYEGSAFTDAFNAFDMVEKQHVLFRKVLANL